VRQRDLGVAALCMVACGTLFACAISMRSNGASVLEQSSLSHPYEQRRQQESQEYDRYLLHEVMEDGNRPKRVVRAPVKGSPKQVVQKSAPRADRMSAGQADADFNTYFAAQAAKAEREDIMRNTQNRIRLVRSALDMPQKQHAQKLRASDPRVAGTVGWDYSWHRATGSGDLQNEQFSTDSWNAKHIATSVNQAVQQGQGVPRSVQRTISAPRGAVARGLVKAGGAVPRRAVKAGGAGELPAMPGSFSELERALH